VPLPEGESGDPGVIKFAPEKKAGGAGDRESGLADKSGPAGRCCGAKGYCADWPCIACIWAVASSTPFIKSSTFMHGVSVTFAFAC
jgi:hypothetical protein